MHLVAVDELATDIDVETPLLARDLGIAPYTARNLLLGERPKVLLRTAEEDHARALLAKLRDRKHTAIACDTRAITPTDSMVQVRTFALGDVALGSDGGEELPYVDVLAILRAVRLDPLRNAGVERPLVRPGAFPAFDVPVRRHEPSEDREQLVYLVRKSGPTWVVRGRTTSFEGLGVRMAPGRTENVLRLIAELHQRAPGAAYDERLMRFHTSSHERFDEQVHLIALAFTRTAKGPYR
jgi:hypothetical protein